MPSWKNTTHNSLPNGDVPGKQDPYNRYGPSLPQRVLLTGAVALSLSVAWWILLGASAELPPTWPGSHSIGGSHLRRVALGVGLSVYFLRLLLTQFAFLRRAISWAEAAMVAGWVAFIFFFLSTSAAYRSCPVGVGAAVGVFLYVLGSWMNTWAEYSRHRWKQEPANAGQLYTRGLFRLCRHPNYLGDLLLFSGLCLVAGRWFTSVIPMIMLCGFIFASIPTLDAHLRAHYGEAFDRYARKTRKLIPFFY